ncbi:MAG: hypothetical protein HYS34_03550 [Acidobacteria bacterium]|nr:hypothetical protein [Acidobacteriota bacterium]
MLVVLAAVAVAAVLPGTMVGADEEKVVVSRPGTVFHLPGASDIRGRGFEKGLDAAMAAGYQPCRVCFAKEAAASRVTGASTGAAALAASGRGHGYGNTPSSNAGQPSGLQVGSLGHRSLEGEVKDPYEDLRTIRTPSKEQGAYSEESYFQRHGSY